MQLARNIPKNDKQHFLGITAWRCTSKLYRWFHNTGKDDGGTGGKNDMIFEDSREAQFVFQVIKMQF